MAQIQEGFTKGSLRFKMNLCIPISSLLFFLAFINTSYSEVERPKILSVRKAKVQTLSSSGSGDSAIDKRKSSYKITTYTAEAEPENESGSYEFVKNIPPLKLHERLERPLKVTVSLFEDNGNKLQSHEVPQKEYELQEPQLIIPGNLEQQEQLYADPNVLLDIQKIKLEPNQAVAYEPQPVALPNPYFLQQVPASVPVQNQPVHFTNFREHSQHQLQQIQVQEPVQQIQPLQNQELYPHPQYNFAYRVHDAKTGTNHGHSQIRNGDMTYGRYAVMDPDGMLRTVSYTSDPVYGFNAVVDRQPVSNFNYAVQNEQIQGLPQGYYRYS